LVASIKNLMGSIHIGRGTEHKLQQELTIPLNVELYREILMVTSGRPGILGEKHALNQKAAQT